MGLVRPPRTLRVIPFLIVVRLLALPVQAQYSGGAGTADDPYQIATAEDLILLGETPEDYDKYFIMTADIDLDPNLPGNRVFDRAVIAPDTDDATFDFQGPAFTGTLDGRGHAVADLVIDSDAAYAGLFGMIGSSGHVCNLRLVGGSVRGQARHVLRGYDGATGGLAAVSQGHVTACGCEVTIEGAYLVGGLVGENDGGTIWACYNRSLISGEEYFIGGLVGRNSYGTILACYNSGSVSGGWYVGGLVGDNRATLSACYSRGRVGGRGSNVAGLVATNYGTISACFWDIDASGPTKSAGGTGLRTSEMQTMQTFIDAGWDFLGERQNGLCECWEMPAEGEYPALSIFNGHLPAVPRGQGAADDPYLLETPEDLATVWYRPTACYQLVTDINLPGITWGMAVIPAFSGTLDGQGHRIMGIRIVGGGDLGLIGCLAEDAAIVGLGLEDVNNVGTGTCVGALAGRNYGAISTSYSTGSVSGQYSVGGLVGENCGTAISDCYSMTSVSGGHYVGGLAGTNYGTISACHSMGSVSGTGSDVGGLAGRNFYGTVSACYSTGSVSGTGENVGGFGGSRAVGGLVGSNSSGTITACRSTGSVNGSGHVGGLVGRNDSIISVCYSAGSVRGTGSNVGGLVGGNSGVITTCYSTGSVSGGHYVGGLVGENDETISGCYSTGSVNGTGLHVGGLVGWNFGMISVSYTTGSVRGTGSNVGGLVGENSGAITTCYSTGSVSGGHYVGGLVGENDGTVSACYSIGSVRGTGSVGDRGPHLGLEDSVGGLVGSDWGTISACFWDTTASVIADGVGNIDPDPNGVEGRSTAQMWQAATFAAAGWDFIGETENGTDDIWWIDEGVDYPRLWWELLGYASRLPVTDHIVALGFEMQPCLKGWTLLQRDRSCQLW